MATYYRWRKRLSSDLIKQSGPYKSVGIGEIQGDTATLYYSTAITIDDNDVDVKLTGVVNSVQISSANNGDRLNDLGLSFGRYYVILNSTSGVNAGYGPSSSLLSFSGSTLFLSSGPFDPSVYDVVKDLSAETPSSYVYSTTASAYPNGGVQGDYYYDQRTTITSPTAPTNLQYPNPIITPTITVSWDAATSNVPQYPIDHYAVVAFADDDDAAVAAILENVKTTSADITLKSVVNGIPVTSVSINVVAYDTNGFNGQRITSGIIPVYFSPTISVPSLAMQGQQITVNWTAIDGATSYTLQRKANTDTDWTQVYSGGNTTFTETVGTWTTVQYRVQAVFDGTPGGWATSESIPVISASALVISGQDGDLGTLINDVPYTISTDTGKQITVRTTVNAAPIFEGNVASGTAESIPVLDLVNGDGTIVIEASVETSSGTVSAARRWTYHKDKMTFTNSGSPSELSKDGETIWPKTLAECVRIPGGRTLEEVMGFPAQICTGSYIGTGTYGVDNPTEITFPFVPDLWGIMGSVDTNDDGVFHGDLIDPWLFPWGLSKIDVVYTCEAQYDDATISFWCLEGTNAGQQLNVSGREYYFIGIKIG